MRKASTALLEQGIQTPSPAPDLIPAETSTENLHWHWYSKRGHFNTNHGPRYYSCADDDFCGHRQSISMNPHSVFIWNGCALATLLVRHVK